jgi:hypothetical protein
MRALALAAFVLLASPGFAVAGCMSDCGSDYSSAVSLCESDDPDEADYYADCITTAKGNYDACTDDCQSVNQTPPLLRRFRFLDKDVRLALGDKR